MEGKEKIQSALYFYKCPSIPLEMFSLCLDTWEGLGHKPPPTFSKFNMHPAASQPLFPDFKL